MRFMKLIIIRVTRIVLKVIFFITWWLRLHIRDGSLKFALLVELLFWELGLCYLIGIFHIELIGYVHDKNATKYCFV